MAKLGHRIAAGIAAVLFLITSVGFSILVIIQMRKDAKLSSNQKNTNTTQESAVSDKKLENYTPSSDPVTELKIIDTKVGDGQEVKPGDTVTAHYTGALVKDGSVFDSSVERGEPATFPLNGVIQGWQQGVPGMKVGGKRRLIIPAALAYGEQGSPPKIGPNEPLVFDIEMIKIGE